MNKCKLFPSILIISLGVNALVVNAQTEQEFEVQEQALQIIDDAEKARQAELGLGRYSHIEGGPVSFSEIARDPDNIRLNFRYAKTQVADGNLVGASSTLERILILNPNLDRVRLFYVHVLYRLDNLKEAQAQIDLLSERALSATDLAELDRLKKQIARQSRPTNYTASIGGGLAYQTNANFAPNDEKVDVILNILGTSIFVPDVPTDEEEDDLSYLGTASLGFRHDLGYQEGHNLFGGIRAYWNEQVDVDTSDYRSYHGNFGGVYRAPWGDLTTQVLAGHFELQRDTFLNFYGIDVNLEREYYAGKLKANARHRTTYEDYDHAGTVTGERTGPRYEFEIGGDYRLTNRQILRLALLYNNKSAREDWQEYDGFGVEVKHTWALKNGFLIRNHVGYSNRDYDESNPRVSFSTREDDDFFYQFTASSLLGRIIKTQSLPAPLRDVRVNTSVRYVNEQSNIQNFEYDNVRAELFFTKRFDF